MLNLLLIFFSLSALAQENFRDFLNPKKDVVMCGRFIEKSKREELRSFQRVRWEDWDKNQVYVIQTGLVRHVFHLISNEHLQGEEEEDELIYRVRYHVLKESPVIKGENLLKFYQKLPFEFAAGEKSFRPRGWEYFQSEMGFYSAQETHYSQQCKDRCLITFVIDKNVSDEKAKTECDKRIEAQPR